MNVLGLFDVDKWILVVLVILVVTFWYLRSQNASEILKIPMPKRFPVFGHYPYLRWPQEWMQMALCKELGNIYALQLRKKLSVIISDPELIKQVFVKDVHCFTNRQAFATGEEVFDKGLSKLEGQEWKHTRNILTPTFSTSKMKKMLPLLNASTKCLAESLLEKAEKKETFEGKDVFGKFTMDVIAKTMFGLDVDCQRDENNEFVRNAKAAMQSRGIQFYILVIAFLTFPKLVKYLQYVGIRIADPKVTNFFIDTTKEVIALRKQGSVENNDFIQLMLNAHVDEEFVKSSAQSADTADAGGDVKPRAKGLTDTEIIAQSIVFFLAGFETTSTLLSWLSYCLATNPQVQDTLRREIQEKLGDKEDVTYDDINGLPYLDMVVCETLRQHPPAVQIQRVCSEDGYNLAGHSLPRGTTVTAAIYQLHHDPDHWPEPFLFNPERFTPEGRAGRGALHNYLWIPFGVGPRNCIGLRFALLQAKLALVAMLRRVSFTLDTSRTPANLYPLSKENEQGFKKMSIHYLDKGIWLIPHAVPV